MGASGARCIRRKNPDTAWLGRSSLATRTGAARMIKGDDSMDGKMADNDVRVPPLHTHIRRLLQQEALAAAKGEKMIVPGQVLWTGRRVR